MTDLVTFIEARLAEDEDLARRAALGQPDWHYVSWIDGVSGPDGSLVVNDRHVDVGVDADDAIKPSEAPHIARHDPARVLREVQAKRKAIETHRWHGPDGCEEDRFCPLLTAMAAVYADNTDYQAEWAP